MSTPPLPADIAGLITLLRVVEAGSFAQAARRAGTTTSAMSKAVARLERARGLRLLHRTTHSLALTPEGDRLIGVARSLAASLAQAETALGELAQGRGGGRVCVTAPASFARACLLPRLPAFLRAHPDVEVEIKFRNEILDLAAEGVDVAVRSGALDRVPGHHAQKLFDFAWIACAAPGYLAARGAPAEPRDLAAHEAVGFRNPATGQLLTWRFKGLRFAPKPRHVADDADAAMRLIAEGFGIGWGPSWLVGPGLRSGAVVEVLRAWRTPEEPLWMVRSSGGRPPRRTAQVMAWLATLPPDGA